MSSILVVVGIFVLIVAFVTGFVPRQLASRELSTSIEAIAKRNLVRRNATKKVSSCSICNGKEVVNCGSCNGSGIDKKNGSVLERWCCKKCKGFHSLVYSFTNNSTNFILQGFGLIPCKCSSAKGLTPEQTGER